MYPAQDLCGNTRLSISTQGFKHFTIALIMLAMFEAGTWSASKV